MQCTGIFCWHFLAHTHSFLNVRMYFPGNWVTIPHNKPDTDADCISVNGNQWLNLIACAQNTRLKCFQFIHHLLFSYALKCQGKACCLVDKVHCNCFISSFTFWGRAFPHPLLSVLSGNHLNGKIWFHPCPLLINFVLANYNFSFTFYYDVCFNAQ